MPQLPLLGPEPLWLPAVLGALARFRFLTVRQLVAHLDEVPAADLVASLDALVAAKVIVRLHPFDGVAGHAGAPVFALGRRGAHLLARYTGEPVVAVPHPRRSLLMLCHEGMVAELGIVLELLHREGYLSLKRFETTRERIATTAFLPGRGELVRVPLVADAFAVVEYGGKLNAFLIECDRGTVSLPRMRLKFSGYHAWWALGGPLKRFGVRGLRVLVIAPNAARLERLREAALEATDGRGSGLFTFALETDITADEPARFLAPVWTPARHGVTQSVPLFPALAADTATPTAA